jgi:predicted Zn-dependent protease
VPDALQTLIRQGYSALSRGRHADAASCCQRALELDHTCVPAHFLVGLVALESGDRVAAISAFGSVTRLKADHAAAWSQLARLFVRSGQPNRADQALANAIAHVGDEPLVCDVIGTVFSQLGDQESAQQWYQRAATGQPDNPGFQVNLASSCVFLGETDRARTILERLLETHPHNAQAHWLLATSRRAADRRHVENLVREVARGNRSGRDFAFLYYALGKELEDLEK